MRKIAVILALFANFSLMFAQGGSNYSVFGIGDIHTNLVARYESVGGTSIAFPSNYAINTRNPAMWADVQTTRIQAGYNYNLRQVLDANEDVIQSNASANHIMGLLAIDTAKGISVSFGIMPYSSVNYLVKKLEFIDTDGFNIRGESKYQGAGGVSQAYLGVSYSPFDFVKLGFSAAGFFGNLYQNISTVFYDYVNQNQVNRRSTIIRGSLLKSGVVLSPFKNFNLGFYYDVMPSYRNEVQIFFDGTDEKNYVKNDSTRIEFVNTKLPDAFGVGFSYQYNNLVFGGDFSMQDFTNFELNKTDRFDYTNSFSASVGFSRLGVGGFRKTIFDKTTYNIGAGMKKLYYKVFGEDINEYYVSVGADIPVAGNFMINSSFTFGKRGLVKGQLLQENFFKLNMSFSLGETWFQRFKDDY